MQQVISGAMLALKLVSTYFLIVALFALKKPKPIPRANPKTRFACVIADIRFCPLFPQVFPWIYTSRAVVSSDSDLATGSVYSLPNCRATSRAIALIPLNGVRLLYHKSPNRTNPVICFSTSLFAETIEKKQDAALQFIQKNVIID